MAASLVAQSNPTCTGRTLLAGHRHVVDKRVDDVALVGVDESKTIGLDGRQDLNGWADRALDPGRSRVVR
jgi:hypothetical protein